MGLENIEIIIGFHTRSISKKSSAKKYQSFLNRNKLMDLERTPITGDLSAIKSHLMKQKNYKNILVYILGGDGTVNLLINYLHSLSIDLSSFIFVLAGHGSGNDLRRSFQEFESGCYTLQPLLVQIDSRDPIICINSFSLGGSAEIAYLRNQIKRIVPFAGGIGYIISLITGLPNFVKKYELFINDREISTRLVISMVGKFFGAGIKVLNKANHKTDNVRLLFVKDIGFVEFIGALMYALVRGVENSDAASEISSDTIAIISRESFKIEVDGEVAIVNQRVDLKRSEDKYTFYNELTYK